MGLKRLIRPDHMPVNKYELVVPGLPLIVFTTISGLEEELQTTDLPDRTTASGGNTNPVEFTATHEMHHTEEVVAMELWFEEAKFVSPLYKKMGTLTHFSISGIAQRVYGLLGIFPTKRKLPDLDMNNEGESGVIEWTFKVDELQFIL